MSDRNAAGANNLNRFLAAMRLSRRNTLLWRNGITWLITIVMTGLFATLSLAHGGGTPQLVKVATGPNELYAYTSPAPVRVGTLHVTVALAVPETEKPVLDAAVRVELKPVDNRSKIETIRAYATRDQAANKTTYETDIQVPEAGQWQVDISYETSEGKGNADFLLEVKPKSPVNWLVIGGIGLALLVGGWLFLTSRNSESNDQNAVQ
ncbi:MAG: hypothetical protein U9R25_02520 [Chloroflexota bacterium]|nr:hypothetical protein [Chloroflexota bacterium]